MGAGGNANVCIMDPYAKGGNGTGRFFLVFVFEFEFELSDILRRFLDARDGALFVFIVYRSD
jgi:hypothetical protein